MVLLRYIKVANNTPKFRLILSAMNTPPYWLAKYSNPILSPLTTNEFTVKKSLDFAEEVVHYDHNLYMASLDIESSFTNIPLEETNKNCVNYLFSNNFPSGKLCRKGLYELLKLATTKSDKQTKLHWVYLYIPQWVTIFFVIMKKFALMNVLLSLNLWFTDITLTIFLF